MANVKEAKLKDLIQDDRNLNAGTERGQQLIEKSLREFGANTRYLKGGSRCWVSFDTRLEIGFVETGIGPVGSEEDVDV